MAEKNKNKIVQNKYFRIGLVFTILAVAVVILILIGVFADRLLFSRNRHFVLKEVKVESSGWWNGNSQKVIQDLQLKPGKTNLFELDLKNLRNKLLEEEPSIAGATVVKVLPDTLVFKITERIPRAFLGKRTSEWLVDDHGIVMSRKSCINLAKDLPVIISLPKSARIKIQRGNCLRELKPALDLLMLARTDYTDLKITAISMKDQNELDFILYYDNKYGPYAVKMPDNKIKYMLEILRTSLKKAIREGDTRRKINLMFDGNVIFRPLNIKKK